RGRGARDGVQQPRLRRPRALVRHATPRGVARRLLLLQRTDLSAVRVDRAGPGRHRPVRPRAPRRVRRGPGLEPRPVPPLPGRVRPAPALDPPSPGFRHAAQRYTRVPREAARPPRRRPIRRRPGATVAPPFTDLTSTNRCTRGEACPPGSAPDRCRAQRLVAAAHATACENVPVLRRPGPLVPDHRPPPTCPVRAVFRGRRDEYA